MSDIRKLALTFKSGIIYKTTGGSDDPFVQVKVGDVVKKTLAMINTTVPEWNETLIFENVKAKDAEGVWVMLWHSDATSNDVIGSVCISALSTQHLTVSVVNEKGVDQATLEIDVAVDDDAADLEENGKVSANARPADSTTSAFSKYVDSYLVSSTDAEKEKEKEKASGRGGGSKSPRSPRSPRSGKGGGDDKKPSGSGSHSGVVYSTSEGSGGSGSNTRSSPTSSKSGSGSGSSGSGSDSPSGVVFGSSIASSAPERRPYNASVSTTSSTSTTTGPDGTTTTTTTYVTKGSASYSSSSTTTRERSPNKGTSPTGSSSTSKTARNRSPGGGSSPSGSGSGSGSSSGSGEEEEAPATKEVVIGGSGSSDTPTRRPYIQEELTPAYAEEVAIKEQKGSDTHMYHWLANDSLAFTAGEQQLTVFLDFPITKDIWRIEAKFYHDEDHPGTTADFGVADSNVISKLYAKWLFNNSDTCAYYLDKTSAKITAGRTHKSLLSAFFGRSGTKFSVEIDMNERLLRFYSGNRLAPASVKIKPASLHVGFSGRFAQRFDNVSVRRLERPTLRPQDKPEPLNWE